jgi:hypothetical protein
LPGIRANKAFLLPGVLRSGLVATLAHREFGSRVAGRIESFTDAAGDPFPIGLFSQPFGQGLKPCRVPYG